MYQEERLLHILEYLNDHQSMSVNEICASFGVSRDTARRDIVKLVEQGAVIRTHGGISMPALKETILAYRERVQSYSEEKMLIGKGALSLLEDQRHYFFDVSTTVCCLAEQLTHNIHISTHSLDIAEVLSNQGEASVFLFGGQLNKANRYFFDAGVMEQLEKIRFDGAFLGAAAVMEDGLYFENQEDAYLKQKVAKRSAKTIILADIHKFSKESRYKGIEWSDIDIMVTNQRPPEAFLDLIREHNIQLLVTGS